MELFVIAILLTFAGAQESQLKGPENTLSVVGSNVTLKCLSPSRNCNGIDWRTYVHGSSSMPVFKGPKTILSSVDRNRYSVDNSSGCDLVIKNVQPTDAGRFICSAILSSSQVTGTAYLIILESQPKCTMNAASVDNTVEGDRVQLNCEVRFSGTNRALMDWTGVTDAPAAGKNGDTTVTINRTYSVVASAPKVPSFTCETSFASETDHSGRPIPGFATNKIPNVTCSTPAIKVLYLVRDVTLTPMYSNYPPGTVITCEAKGYPSPNFKWQENENNGIWMDIQNQNGDQFTMTDVTSKRYRCVAVNVVRGRSYNATSREILVNNTEFRDNLSSTRPVTFENYFGIGIGFGLLIAILLAIGVVAILIGLGYLKFQPRTSNKSSDGVVRHQDHEMSPTPHQRSAIPRTGAPLPGEQESTYASLGEDRDVNEYASLEQRQKGKPKK